jgi:Tuberculosis necrotizing toxin
VLGGLRDQLDALGLSRVHIQLPGEDVPTPLEGALRVRTGDSRFVLETVDYGHSFRLLTGAESEMPEAVLAYVSRPLPPVRVMSQQDLETVVNSLSGHYFDLRDRAGEEGGVVIDIPAGVPIDRIGTLDGVHTYPLGSSFESRSLPPTALQPGTALHKFITAADVRVAAAITPPWFGHPGGGLRFTLQQPETGLRDLVVSGRLQRLQV